MNCTKKETYEIPSAIAVEIVTQRTVCMSTQDYDYGDLDEEDNEG